MQAAKDNQCFDRFVGSFTVRNIFLLNVFYALIVILRHVLCPTTGTLFDVRGHGAHAEPCLPRTRRKLRFARAVINVFLAKPDFAAVAERRYR